MEVFEGLENTPSFLGPKKTPRLFCSSNSFANMGLDSFRNDCGRERKKKQNEFEESLI